MDYIQILQSKPNLTKREQQVLRPLTQGLKNKQIAEELKISESTVKKHIANIITKLGVGSRTEAVARALKEKLIK
jgi:NarL family two-component system response regulator LiaR